MESEPTRLVSLINSAIAATIAIPALLGWISAELAGGLTLALAAWVYVIGEVFLRNKVTPVASPTLTSEQASKVTIDNG